MSKKSNRVYATPAETRRWIKCLDAWAKLKNKSQDDICDLLGFSHRSSWFRLKNGEIKRIKLSILNHSAEVADLDTNFIKGFLDLRRKFAETKNVFDDFKYTYREYINNGNKYQASQIIRKAALFMFEVLVPRDIVLRLELENKFNVHETARIHVSVDDKDYFVINIYGGNVCVQYNLARVASEGLIPVMEGDLDMHAVRSIKNQFVRRDKQREIEKKVVVKFSTNAKKMAERSFAQG
jgi:hypothetical protein